MENRMPSIPSKVVVGENIRSQRVARGWSQTHLAEKAGLSQPRIAEIEGGRFDQRTATIDKIADALNVSPASLMVPVETTISS